MVVLVLVVLHGGGDVVVAGAVRVGVRLPGVLVLVLGVGRGFAHACHYMHMRAGNERRDRAALDEQVDLAVEMFRMLADATRVRLLWELGAGEMSVSDLAEAVGKKPPSTSQHLAKLRMARLVTTRRNGTQVLYRLANEHVGQLVEDALRHSEHVGPGVPAHHRRD